MKKGSNYSDNIFWTSHPSFYVSMYMNYDWLEMNTIDFMSKYIQEAFRTKNKDKKSVIISVLSLIWRDMETVEKYTTLSIMLDKKHVADSFHFLLFIEDVFKCDFVKRTIRTTYQLATKRNYDTNYLVAIL